MEEKKLIGKIERSRSLLILALIASLLAFSSCSAWSRDAPPLRPGALVPSPASSDTETEESGAGHTVVLVAIDGVRAEDLFNGIDRKIARAQGMREDELLTPRALAPNLHELADSGAALGIPGHGAGMVA